MHGIAELPTYRQRTQVTLASRRARKSGGVRIIYRYHDDHMPLYLLTLFAKGDKANLTKTERNELVDLVHILVNLWKG